MRLLLTYGLFRCGTWLVPSILATGSLLSVVVDTRTFLSAASALLSVIVCVSSSNDWSAAAIMDDNWALKPLNAVENAWAVFLLAAVKMEGIVYFKPSASSVEV